MRLGRKLLQTAVLWEPDIARDVFGADSYAPGVEVSVRWQDTAEEFVNTLGERDVSAAVIYIETAAAVAPGWKIYLGATASLTAAELADPNLVLTAHTIRARADSPSRTADQMLTKLWTKA